MAINQSKETIYSIQVLRGLASLMVVLYHASVNSDQIFHAPFLAGFFNFGGSGVDIFFVLSGFIITYTNLASLGNKEKFGAFLKKRFIRIYPIYWLIISFFLLVQTVASSYYYSHYPLDFNNLVSTYLLLPKHIMVNGVSWSLTNEIFFYIIFSLIFFIRKKKLAAIFLILFTLAPVVFYVFGWYTTENKWLFLLLFAMNIEFSLGVLAALLFRYIPGKHGIYYIITGALLFLACGLLYNNDTILFGAGFNRVIFFGLPSFLIILGAVAYEKQQEAFKPRGFLLALGDASYSLYLLHLPLLVAFFKIILGRGVSNNIIIHVAIIAVIVGLCFFSILFYQKIEKPLISRINKTLNPRYIAVKGAD